VAQKVGAQHPQLHRWAAENGRVRHQPPDGNQQVRQPVRNELWKESYDHQELETDLGLFSQTLNRRSTSKRTWRSMYNHNDDVWIKMLPVNLHEWTLHNLMTRIDHNNL